MGEHLGGVVGAVADVHHHLGDVHRPALGEDPGAEDGPGQRLASVRPRQLEVVAGRRLVDRQDSQRAAVVLAQHRGDLVVGPIVGRRRDREEAVEALVQRPGRDEHRAAERPQERRRPDDLERLVRQADEIALANEVLDVPMLLAAEVEQLGGLRVVLPDGIEHAAGQRVGVVRHRIVADPGRPQLARQARHLGADLVVRGCGSPLELVR